MYSKPFSLRGLLINFFRGRKDFVSYTELKKLAEDNGYKVSNLERRLRTETSGNKLPVKKYGSDKKPIRGSQAAVWYKWVGGFTTVFNLNHK